MVHDSARDRRWVDRRRLGAVGDAALVAALVAVAVVTRMHPLAPRSLWLDDSWVALGSKAQGLAGLSRTTATSPLFAIATDLWLKAVGLTSLRAQMLPFVAGVLGPAGMYLAARSMRFGRSSALLAAGLILVAPNHLLYSSRVKQYTLEAILSMIVVAVAWRVIATPDGRHWCILTLTAIAVTVASMAVAPVAAGAYASALVATLRARRGFKAAVAGTVAYGAVAGAWFVTVIKPISHPALRAYWRAAGAFWTESRAAPLSSLHLVLERVAQGFSALPPNLTLAVLAFAAVVAFVRSIERALLVVVPLVAGLVLSALHLDPIGARVDVYLYPTLAVLVAYAVQPLLERRPWLFVLPVAALAALLVATPLPHYYPNEDMAPLVARLEARSRPEDPVLVFHDGLYALALYTRWPVHIVRNSTEPVPFSPVIARPNLAMVWASSRGVTGRLQQPHSVRRVWFIGSHGHPAAIEMIDRAVERQGFTLESRTGDSHAWLYEFVRRLTPGRGRALQPAV